MFIITSRMNTVDSILIYKSILVSKIFITCNVKINNFNPYDFNFYKQNVYKISMNEM